MQFKLWIESAQNNHYLCQIIDALTSKDNNELGGLGDWLQDHDPSNPLGSWISAYVMGKKPKVPMPPTVQHTSYTGHESYQFQEVPDLKPPFSQYSYVPSYQSYRIWIRLDSPGFGGQEFEWMIPTENVCKGRKSIVRRNQIMKVHKFGAREEQPTLSQIPKYFEAPAPSENALKTLAQGILSVISK